MEHIYIYIILVHGMSKRNAEKKHPDSLRIRIYSSCCEYNANLHQMHWPAFLCHRGLLYVWLLCSYIRAIAKDVCAQI